MARNACVGERVDCRAAVDPHRRTAWQTYRKSSDFSALRSAARLCHPVPRFSAMSSANLPREEKGNHLLPWNCTCALSEASHARYPPQRNPWSLAYPSMTRSRNARVGRLYVQLDLPMPQSERICTNSPSPSGGLLRGLLPRLTSVRLRGTVVTSSATSSGWSCVPAPRRRSRRLSSGVRNVRPNAQSSGIESCQKASTILGAFHASTRRAFGSAVSSRRKLEWKR